VEVLRQSGFGGRIVMICKEHFLPYDRPKLSKAMSISPDKILFRSADFYAKHSIETLLGVEVFFHFFFSFFTSFFPFSSSILSSITKKKVLELNAEAKLLKLSNNSILKYDKALIATGGM
jgi:NAD(P)H-nitrite reductase large subunit